MLKTSHISCKITTRTRERKLGEGMSQCVVPNWNNLRVNNSNNNKHQRQAEEGNNNNRSSQVDFDSHLLFHQGFSQIVPMSNNEVTELTWENGQPAMHELGVGGMLFPPLPLKPIWGGVNRAGDTLESIVQQATYCYTKPASQNMENMGSSGGKWAENSGPMQNQIPPPPHPPSGFIKKRTRSESEHSRMPNNDRDSACASENAAFCRDSNNNDTTMMTWASHESHRTKTTTDEDSACHGGSENNEEERETKEETGRSSTTRKGRAAAVHNQSERRRRDRINQKMKALQKLVPNASKTDKASMLDEVIEYLKQLQAQVQMMSNARFMPQIMMPSLGMQQHLQQMSLLARMGMGAAGLGMGLGMLDTTNIGHNPIPSHQIPHLLHPNQVPTTPSGFVPPGAFVVPQMIHQTQQQNSDPGPSSSAPLQDPYAAALFVQSMNMDLYNRMATLHRQQQQQQTAAAQSTSNQLHSNHHVQGG